MMLGGRKTYIGWICSWDVKNLDHNYSDLPVKFSPTAKNRNKRIPTTIIIIAGTKNDQALRADRQNHYV